MDRALIIDGNNFYNIAYYSAKGDAEALVIRFFELLNDAYLRHDNEFEFLFIVWDSRKSNRKKKYPYYKANRKPKPEGFYDTLSYVEETLEMRMVQQYTVSGFEGDDLMAAVVDMCNKKGYSSTVATSDHDMYQLLSEITDIYDPSKKAMVTSSFFEEKYKISANQWKFVKALMGDGGDNVSGVKGVGEINALKAIQLYSDLDNLYNSDMKGLPKGVINKLKKVDSEYNAKNAAYEALELVSFFPIELSTPVNAGITPLKVNRSIYVEAGFFE